MEGAIKIKVEVTSPSPEDRAALMPEQENYTNNHAQLCKDEETLNKSSQQSRRSTDRNKRNEFKRSKDKPPKEPSPSTDINMSQGVQKSKNQELTPKKSSHQSARSTDTKKCKRLNRYIDRKTRNTSLQFKRRNNHQRSSVFTDGHNNLKLKSFKKGRITHPVEKSLYICEMKRYVNKATLFEYFETFGEVVDVTICYRSTSDQNIGKSNYGFVHFADHDSVDKVQADRPHFLEGHPFVTRRCLPLQQRYVPLAKEKTPWLVARKLPATIKKMDLSEYFGQFGLILSIIMGNGYADILFDDYDSVDKALVEERHCISNRLIEVEKSKNFTSMYKKQKLLRSRLLYPTLNRVPNDDTPEDSDSQESYLQLGFLETNQPFNIPPQPAKSRFEHSDSTFCTHQSSLTTEMPESVRCKDSKRKPRDHEKLHHQRFVQSAKHQHSTHHTTYESRADSDQDYVSEGENLPHTMKPSRDRYNYKDHIYDTDEKYSRRHSSRSSRHSSSSDKSSDESSESTDRDRHRRSSRKRRHSSSSHKKSSNERNKKSKKRHHSHKSHKKEKTQKLKNPEHTVASRKSHCHSKNLNSSSTKFNQSLDAEIDLFLSKCRQNAVNNANETHKSEESDESSHNQSPKRPRKRQISPSTGTSKSSKNHGHKKLENNSDTSPGTLIKSEMKRKLQTVISVCNMLLMKDDVTDKAWWQ